MSESLGKVHDEHFFHEKRTEHHTEYEQALFPLWGAQGYGRCLCTYQVRKLNVFISCYE